MNTITVPQIPGNLRSYLSTNLGGARLDGLDDTGFDLYPSKLPSCELMSALVMKYYRNAKLTITDEGHTMYAVRVGPCPVFIIVVSIFKRGRVSVGTKYI